MLQSTPGKSRPGSPFLRSLWRTIVAASALFAGGPLAAQDAEGMADTVGAGGWELVEDVPDEAIDEIIVIAPQSVAAIKAQIVRVERKMYGLYNEMNTDREYDIYCRREGVYASRRKERVCLPQFEHGVLEESWNDLSTWTGAGRPEAELRAKREILRQKMIDFAEQNPALKDAIFERARLQRSLSDAQTSARDAPEE